MMRIFSATKNSLRGIVDGVKTEAAVREEAIAFALAVPIGFVIAPSLAWYVAMIAALLWSVTSWSIVKDITWACVLFLPLAPWLTLFARVLWIYLDQTIDPDRPA